MVPGPSIIVTTRELQNIREHTVTENLSIIRWSTWSLNKFDFTEEWQLVTLNAHFAKLGASSDRTVASTSQTWISKHVSQINQKTQLAVRENILQTRIFCVRISNSQETEIARSSSNSPKTTSALIIDDRWKLVRFRVHTRMKARAASSGNFWILRPARKKKVQWNSSVFSRVSLLPWFKEKWQNSGGNSRDRCNNGFLYFLSLHHATLFLSSYSDNRELYSLYPIYFDLYFRNRAICDITRTTWICLTIERYFFFRRTLV